MRKFITYIVLGTLASFAVILYLSLWPHMAQLPAFANGITPGAVMQEFHIFAVTLVISWIAWWSVSGILSVLLLSIGKHTWTMLFAVSLTSVFGITVLIT